MGSSDFLDKVMQAQHGVNFNELATAEISTDEFFVEPVVVKDVEIHANEQQEEEKQAEGAVEVASEGAVEEVKEDSQFANQELDIEALLLQKLEEKSGGKFKSFDDLTKEEKKELEFKDESSAKLFKAIKDNDLETVKEFIDKKLFDANKLGTIDAVTLYYKEKYPHLTEEEIGEELYDKYGVGKLKLSEDDKALLDDDQIVAHERELKRAARELKKVEAEAKKYLNDNKSIDFDLPEVELGTKIPSDYVKYDEAVQEFTKTYQEQQQQVVSQWEGIVQNELPKFEKSQSFKLDLGKEGGEFDFNYELSDNEIKQLKDYTLDYGNTTNYDQKFVKKEGENIRVDVSSLARENVMKLFGDKILKSAVKQAIAIGKEEVLSKTIKNSDWSNKAPSREAGQKLNFFQQQLVNK